MFVEITDFTAVGSRWLLMKISDMAFGSKRSDINKSFHEQVMHLIV